MVFPLLWFSLAFIFGIVVGSLVDPAWQPGDSASPTWLVLAALAIVAALIWGVLQRRLAGDPERARGIRLLVICAAFLFLGAARYEAKVPEPDPSHIAWYNDRDYDMLVTGAVTRPPDVRDLYTNLTIDVESLDAGDGDVPVSGLLLARVSNDRTYRYGERLRLRGGLETPPDDEDFSYQQYLAFYGVYSLMGRADVTQVPGFSGSRALALIYFVRVQAIQQIYEIYPDPEASLIAGILLGADAGLPADLQKDFRDTGTSHIIAISGFNISIIAALFVAIFGRLFGPRRGAIISIAGIILYTVMVGADPAVVRAAFMGIIAIFAALLGRRQVGLVTLFLVAAIMAWHNPLVLSNVGFQLSFGATLGLILYGEPLQAWAENAFQGRPLAPPATAGVPQERARKAAALVSEYLLLTLAAQVTALPLMAYHFGRISLVSLVANPFILPVQPPLMIGGALAVVLSFISVSLGKAAGLLTLPFSGYTIRAVEFFGGWPGAVITLGSFSLVLVILYYALLLGWTFAPPPVRERVKPRIAPALGLAALLVLAAVAWRGALAAPDSHLHLTFMDVGSGDAILIQTPTGRNVLVNGGPSASRLSDALGRRLPPTARTLDWLIVASTQENEIGALPSTLDRFAPREVLWAGRTEASPSARALNEWLADNDVPLTRAAPGQTLDLGDGATLKVLTVGERGAILLLEWGNFRALLPVGPDFEALGELEQGGKVGPVTALLLGESGYGPSNPPDWIANLRPHLAILSVGAGDKKGLPDEDALDAIADYNLLRTDRDGWIELTTDGEQMWVEVEKQGAVGETATPEEQ
jgi:competence protein ComEC